MWSCFMSGPGLSCDLLNQRQQTGNAERVSQVRSQLCSLRSALCSVQGHVYCDIF